MSRPDVAVVHGGGMVSWGMNDVNCGGRDWRMVSSGGLGLHFHADLPKHSGKFAGDGHLDFVVVHEALAQLGEAQMEAVLGLP